MIRKVYFIELMNSDIAGAIFCDDSSSSINITITEFIRCNSTSESTYSAGSAFLKLKNIYQHRVSYSQGYSNSCGQAFYSRSPDNDINHIEITTVTRTPPDYEGKYRSFYMDYGKVSSILNIISFCKLSMETACILYSTTPNLYCTCSTIYNNTGNYVLRVEDPRSDLDMMNIAKNEGNTLFDIPVGTNFVTNSVIRDNECDSCYNTGTIQFDSCHFCSNKFKTSEDCVALLNLYPKKCGLPTFAFTDSSFNSFILIPLFSLFE